MTQVSASSSSTEQVFLGGASNLDDLLDGDVAAELQEDNVGLYGHTNGIFQLLEEGELPQIVAEFVGRGSGVAEFGEILGHASGSVTVENSTASDQRLYIGTNVSSSNGSLFQIVNNAHAAPLIFDAALGLYYYDIQPGLTYTLLVEAVDLGVDTNLGANFLTSFSSANGLTIISSSATTGGQAWSSTAENGVVQTNLGSDGSVTTNPGFLTTNYSDYTTIFTANSLSPLEANVNIESSYAWTQQDLQSWEAYVNNARALGVLNLAPIWSDNGYSADLSQPFATSPWYATVREAALYGGGLSFDLPPNYAWLREPSYLENIVQQIQWATANGLRTSIIISPYDVDDAANREDDTLLSATQTLVTYLQENNALPSQFIVENYNGDGSGNLFEPTDPNNLVAVAQYLSSLKLTVSNSEYGLEAKNSSSSPDVIVTGAAPNITIGPNSSFLFSETNIYGIQSTQVVSVKVTIASVNYGSFSSNYGTVGNDGSVISLSGSVSEVSEEVKQIQFTPTAEAEGATSVSIVVQDTAGSVITNTDLTIDTHTPSAPVLGVGLDTLVLNVSEDKWTQDAQFTVSVDGNQVGGVYSTSALESAGATQNITLTGLFGHSAHQVTVDFLNDLYGGPGKDTNLYVNSITLDGTAVTESAEIPSAGPVSFAIPALSGPTGTTITGAVMTNQTQPLLQGTAEAGATVTVTDTLGGISSTLGTALAAANGSWSLTPAAALASGTYQISAIQTDAAGTSSVASTAQSLTIDTHQLSAPVVILASATTNQTQPLLQGTAEAGAMVVVSAFLNGVQTVLGTATATAGGSWSLISNASLADGAYAISAIQTDAAGTSSATSAQQSLTIDTRVPSAPLIKTLDTVVLNVSADIWTAPAQFTVMVDGTQIGGVYSTTALKSAGQSTSLTLTGQFGSGLTGTGSHLVVVDFLNDLYGGPGKDTNLYVNSITFDGMTVAENAEQPGVGNGYYWTGTPSAAQSAAYSGAIVTNNTKPLLQGTAGAGATVTVTASLNGVATALGTVTASASGIWSLASTTALAAGTYHLTAIQTDMAGNTSAASTAQSLTIDTHTPSAPVLGVGLDTLVLNVSEDKWTQDAQFTVSVDGNQVGGVYSTSALESAGATQNITLTGLFGHSAHQVTVDFLNDLYGGPGKDTNLYVNSITLDGTAVTESAEIPSAGPVSFAIPALSGPTGTTITGAVMTNQTQPLLQGTAEAGATVTVTDTLGGISSTLGTALAAANGSWSLTPAAALASGTYQISAIQTDAAGTSSVASTAQSLTIDTHQLSAPVVILASATTNQTQPLLQGTAEAGAMVVVSAFLNGVQTVLGTATATAGGSWSLISNASLADGAYAISAIQTDAAGTSSATSAQQSLTIDTRVPSAPLIKTLDTVVLNVSADIWTAPAQFTVMVDGTQIGGVYSTTALKSAGQSTSLTLTGQFGSGLTGTGSHLVVVDFLNDLYGGPGKDTNLYVNSITFDGMTVAENAEQPGVGNGYYWTGTPSAAQSAAYSGAIVTNNTKPLLQGTAGAGATVTVTASLNGVATALGTVTASASGIWSLASTTALAAGTYHLTAIQTDMAGNTSAASTAQSLTIDTHTPSAPVLGVGLDTLVLNVSEDKWTQDAQFTVSVDGNQVGGVYSTSALESAGATQNITLTGLFGHSAHQVTVDFLNDLYGGPGKDTNLYVNSITLDGTAVTESAEIPSAGPVSFAIPALSGPTGTTITGAVMTNQTQPLLQGTAEAGATVTVTDTLGGISSTLGTALAAANGSWSLTPAAALASGTYQISAIQTDAAGTSSVASTTTLTVFSDTPNTASATGSATIGSATIPTVSGSGQMTFIASASTIGLQNGASVSEIGGRNTIVLPISGTLTLSGQTMSNGDVFDLRSALANAGWDGRLADLNQYFTSSTSNSGKDLVISTHSVGGAIGLQLTLSSQGSYNLTTFENHSILS